MQISLMLLALKHYQFVNREIEEDIPIAVKRENNKQSQEMPDIR
jgi:hypothetical protein